MISADELRATLSFDPATGRFIWLRPYGTKTKIGSVAGGRSKHQGYSVIWINKKSYRAHRLAWLYMTGAWPIGEIDHINGDRSDNRIANLRDVTAKQNQQNRRYARPDNVSSLIGAGWIASRKKWRARICLDRRSIYLGYFDTKELAHDAYLQAKRNLHPTCTI